MLKRVGTLLVAAATMAACSEPTVPTGITPRITAVGEQGVLARLSCRVDVAAQSMSCGETSPAAVSGRSADIILGGQNTYVTLTSSGVVNNGTTITANVTVKNLTVQPMATADGTTPSATGVRVFFYTAPTAPVTVGNADSSATFTAANQPYFQYSGATLGADGILSSGETSLPKSWVFNLNGGGAFTFQVLISAVVPDETGILRWTRSTLTKAGGAEQINTVWGGASNDVWTGGTAGASALHHWDGTSWNAMGGAEVAPNDVQDIWGSSSSNVYAVGGTKIQQYNGSIWTDVSSGASSGLLAVWGSSATDVYAGGLNGTLVHSTGGAFTPVAGTGLGTSFVDAIWGTSSIDVYLGGSGVRHWNGTAWSGVSAGIANVHAIWGASATDIWVAGDAGAISHWNGATWAPSTLGTADFSGLWGTSGTDVYAVNRAGEIYHYNGAWVPYTGLTANTALLGIWGSGNKDVWAVGTDNTFSNNVAVHGTR
jgi:hypothetical protein